MAHQKDEQQIYAIARSTAPVSTGAVLFYWPFVEISRNKQTRHEGESRRLRLQILRTLVGVWGEQPIGSFADLIITLQHRMHQD